MMEPNYLSIDEAVQLLRDGALSPHALTEACLRQIERLNPRLNAFITVIEDDIARSAEGATWQSPVKPETAASPSLRSDTRLAVSLAGIPIAIKDLFETKGIRTTAGSKFFADYVPANDAAVVQKLKEAGAIILGKTNTHEIALGVTSNNPHFGVCRNPWDTRRIPGGSSGGSAAAVASGMALAALGTDTGGSIRIPAALCGVVGLKPTYGRASLRGVFPLSWNLDHAGPLTRTVKDTAYLLQVIAGYDSEDPACTNVPVDDYLSHIEEGIRGLHFAQAVGDYVEDSDDEVLNAIADAVKVLEGLGASVEKVETSFLREAALANGLMTQADGAAYHHERLVEHPEWFGTDVRQRLEIGRNFTSTEYSLARRSQAEMKHRLGKLFERYDCLLLPTTPITAPLIEGGDAIEQARRLTRFTAPFNLTGLPAISLPCGFSREGLPIGLQVVAPWWAEAGLLRAAQAYEGETGWRKSRPPMV
jgi:aspartyl-tRNA(Asn)/glutamyl-tRNA(Gln) amidotransferase subunit A